VQLLTTAQGLTCTRVSQLSD